MAKSKSRKKPPADPRSAAAYLNATLADGNRAAVKLALHRLAEAYGGVSKLAQHSGLDRVAPYRTLSRRGNPSFKTLSALLEAMGMRLAVEPVGRQRWPAGDPPL